MRVTPWFPADIKPVRDGAYQTKVQEHLGYSYWELGRWGNQCGSLSDLSWHIKYGGRMPGEQGKKWRGLTEGSK